MLACNIFALLIFANSSRFIAPIIMALVFFSVVTPTGLFMRLLRKDILNLKRKDVKSYWILKNNSNRNMKNQF